MWDRQAEAMSGKFRVLRYDRRGHGESTAAPAPYSMADLGGDVLALLDALRIERTHFCGLSIGGLVGQWLGVHAGERLDRDRKSTRLNSSHSCADRRSSSAWRKQSHSVQQCI